MTSLFVCTDDIVSKAYNMKACETKRLGLGCALADETSGPVTPCFTDGSSTERDGVR